MSHYRKCDLVIMWSRVLSFCCPLLMLSIVTLHCRHWQLCAPCRQHNMYLAVKSGFLRVFWPHVKDLRERKQGRMISPTAVHVLLQRSTENTQLFPSLRQRLSHLTRSHTLLSMSCLKLKRILMLTLGLHYLEINFLLAF